MGIFVVNAKCKRCSHYLVAALDAEEVKEKGAVLHCPNCHMMAVSPTLMGQYGLLVFPINVKFNSK